MGDATRPFAPRRMACSRIQVVAVSLLILFFASFRVAEAITTGCPEVPFTIQFPDAPKFQNPSEPLMIRPDVQMTPIFLRYSRCSSSASFRWESSLGTQFTYAINGTDSQRELQIRAGVFQNDVPITFTLTMTWCSCVTSAVVSIIGNTPPSTTSGTPPLSLPVTLTSGSAATVSAAGWTDVDGISKYYWGYIDPSMPGALIIVNSTTDSTTRIYPPAVSVETQVTFVVIVEDAKGLRSRVTTTSQVLSSGFTSGSQADAAISAMIAAVPPTGQTTDQLIIRAGTCFGAARLLIAESSQIDPSTRRQRTSAILQTLLTGFAPPLEAFASYTGTIGFLTAGTDIITESMFIDLANAVNTALGNTDKFINGAEQGLYTAIDNLMAVLRSVVPTKATHEKFETTDLSAADRITGLIDALYRTHAREMRGTSSRLDSGTVFSANVVSDTFSMQSSWSSSWAALSTSTTTMLTAQSARANANVVVPVQLWLSSMPWPNSVLYFIGAVSLRFDPFKNNYASYPATLSPVVHFGLRDESGKEVVGGQGLTRVPATSNATTNFQGVYARMNGGRWSAMSTNLCECELNAYAMVPSFIFNAFYTNIAIPLPKETALLTRPEDDDAPGWAIMLICVFAVLFGAALLLICLMFVLMRKIRPTGPLVGRVPGMDEAFYHEGR